MSISREVLAKFITPGCFFVETGTRWGDTCIRAAEFGAGSVRSCEIDRIMAAIAGQHVEDALGRLGILAHVEYMDSPAFLRIKVGTADVVFLDAHTDHESPILRELSAIASWSVKPSRILIDDMRLFRSNHWGISIEEVIATIGKIGDYEYSYEHGVEPEDILVARLK